MRAYDIAAIIKESLDFKQPILLHAVGDRTVEIVFNALARYGVAVIPDKCLAKLAESEGR